MIKDTKLILNKVIVGGIFGAVATLKSMKNEG